MKRSTVLKNRLKEPKAVIAPGVYDSLSARSCGVMGFAALRR